MNNDDRFWEYGGMPPTLRIPVLMLWGVLLLLLAAMLGCGTPPAIVEGHAFLKKLKDVGDDRKLSLYEAALADLKRYMDDLVAATFVQEIERRSTGGKVTTQDVLRLMLGYPRKGPDGKPVLGADGKPTRVPGLMDTLKQADTVIARARAKWDADPNTADFSDLHGWIADFYRSGPTLTDADKRKLLGTVDRVTRELIKKNRED